MTHAQTSLEGFRTLPWLVVFKVLALSRLTMNHWTVLEGMDAGQLYVFDNGGLTSIEWQCVAARRVVAKLLIAVTYLSLR